MSVPTTRRRFRRRAALMLLGFALDRTLGDPVRPTHPARLLGLAIERIERILRPRLKGPQAERAGGAVLAVGLPAATYALVRFALRRLPGRTAFVAEAWLIGTALAGRDLGDAALRVNRGLGRDLGEGRREVGMIVGRDTAEMTEAEVVRATVETVAENTSDGVVAPLLYASLGGAPVALAYKGVSTLDSMVGYRNERYRHFGWASARLDDLLNYAPARLTALLATAAAGRPEDLWGWWRDRIHHSSPNAGLVEASFAHSLGLKLGGEATYGGKTVRRAEVGSGGRPPGPGDVERTVRLSEEVGVLSLGLAAGGLLAAGGRS